jgi:hypothetical protein
LLVDGRSTILGDAVGKSFEMRWASDQVVLGSSTRGRRPGRASVGSDLVRRARSAQKTPSRTVQTPARKVRELRVERSPGWT